MKTFAGSSFMTGFLTWYYSWSPLVADAIAPSEGAKAAMRVALQPLLGILQVATTTFSALSFNGEFTIIMAGLVSAALIGLVYFVPLMTLAFFRASRLRRSLALPLVSRVLPYTALPWAASVALIAVAEVATFHVLTVAATLEFVSLTVVMAVGTTSIWLARFFKRR